MGMVTSLLSPLTESDLVGGGANDFGVDFELTGRVGPSAKFL